MSNVSDPGDTAPRGRSGIAYVWLAGILAVLASAPALFAREIFGDDWTVYYVYWTEGATAVARLMSDVAHAGYTIPMEMFLSFGGNTPEIATRMIGLGCHVLNAVLFYRILSTSSHTRAIASLFTALFLLSPFYVIRLTQNAGYDFFLTFYFLSYVLMNAQSRVSRWLAPFSLFFSLSLETLIALEPLRVLLTRRPGERWTTWLAKLLPFWLAVLAVIILRLTIMGKTGHYAGQYAPVHDAKVILSALNMHLHAFPRALSFAREYAFAFLGRTAAALLISMAMLGFLLLGKTTFRTEWLPKDRASGIDALLLVFVGAAITLVGGLPYALVGIYGDVTRGESRLLFPSQFGVLLLMAIAIQCIPFARLRAAVAGGAIALFALSMAHDSKWLLYDGLVGTDLMRQARAALLADPEPKVVKLEILPNSYTLFFRNRCLGAAEMNTAQMILRDKQTQPSFIYTSNCGDFTDPQYVPSGRCPVSYLDGFPCPARRETWSYRPAPGIPPLEDIGMVELFSDLLEQPSATGGRGEFAKLTDGQPSPLPRADYEPSCQTPGVRGLLWLLAMPKPGCRATPAQR